MNRGIAHVDETTKIRTDMQTNPKWKKTEHGRKMVDEEENQKQIAEILEAGGENAAKAAKAITKQEKEKHAVEQKKEEEILNALDMKKRFYESYKSSLASALSELLQELDWIKGWRAEVIVTDGSPISIKGKGFKTKDGVLLVVITPDGRVLHQGITITQQPPLDYAAIVTIAMQVENTIDKERGLLLDGSDKKEDTIINQYGKPIATNTPANVS